MKTEEFKSIVKVMKHAVAKEETRPMLTAMHCEPFIEEISKVPTKTHIVTADGFRLAHYIQPGTDLMGDIDLKSKEVAEVLKNKDKSLDVNVAALPKIEGTYPNWLPLIPKDDGRTSFVVSILDLLTVTRALADATIMKWEIQAKPAVTAFDLNWKNATDHELFNPKLKWLNIEKTDVTSGKLTAFLQEQITKGVSQEDLQWLLKAIWKTQNPTVFSRPPGKPNPFLTEMKVSAGIDGATDPLQFVTSIFINDLVVADDFLKVGVNPNYIEEYCLAINFPGKGANPKWVEVTMAEPSAPIVMRNPLLEEVIMPMLTQW